MRSCSASEAAAGSPVPPTRRHVVRENWYLPRYWPVGETAVGSPPDSHWAIFAARCRRRRCRSRRRRSPLHGAAGQPERAERGRTGDAVDGEALVALDSGARRGASAGRRRRRRRCRARTAAPSRSSRPPSTLAEPPPGRDGAAGGDGQRERRRRWPRPCGDASAAGAPCGPRRGARGIGAWIRATARGSQDLRWARRNSPWSQAPTGLAVGLALGPALRRTPAAIRPAEPAFGSNRVPRSPPDGPAETRQGGSCVMKRSTLPRSSTDGGRPGGPARAPASRAAARSRAPRSRA